MTKREKITYYQNDLDKDHNLEGDLAIDCESLGLNIYRDRLCTVQICDENQNSAVVHFPKHEYKAENLCKLLSDQSRTKIFHYARYDITMIKRYLSVDINPLYCTKIASRLVRTYTDKHGLKDLIYEMLNISVDKRERASYWGADNLTDKQMDYVTNDVIYLHELRDKLNIMLERENRTQIARGCFAFLPIRSALDLLGWQSEDIFSHSK